MRTDLVEVGALVSAGTFEQSGGGVQVGSLTIGSRLDSFGTFNMSAGTLTANWLQVGRDGVAAGTFLQSGGSISAVSANLNGLVSIAGGSLQTSFFGAPAGPITNHGIIRQTGGATNFGNIDGAGKIEVSGNGSMTSGRVRQSAVHLAGNGKITTSSASKVTHVVPLLSFDESGGAVHGTWDLADGALVVDYGSTSPAPAIRRYVKSGYAAGSWNGAGLSSSKANAAPGTALGYAESGEIFGATGGVFRGVLVDGSAILVGYTRYGDANLDGKVNLADFNRLASSFGRSNKVWSGGDFNYDGLVNLSDFNLLAANFGLSASGPEVTPEDWASLAAAVPEPSLLMLAGVASVGLLRRRHRRASPALRR